MNDLTTVEQIVQQLGLSTQYGQMLAIVQESEQAVALATAQHGTGHSQFQYATIDCSGPVAGPTKLRNWRQVLAVIEHTRDALDEAAFKLREARIKEAIFAEKAGKIDGPQSELLRIKADKEASHAGMIERSMAGAIRKLVTYTLQFRELERQIRAELGKPDDEPITEEDFERDEERFHIMKVFQQAIQAARGNGRIDHGNMIYFDDLGIPGVMAQEEVGKFFETERRYRELNPSHVAEVYGLQLDFLEAMARKFKGCSASLARSRGLLPGVLHDATLKLSHEGGG